jgi:hypothetical protein
MAKPQPLQATIPAGQALSSSIDLTSQSVVMLIVPDDWSPANVTFQVSMDNVLFHDLFDAMGNEILRPICVGSAVQVDPTFTQYVNYFKIRSGPRNNPIPQSADRVWMFVTTPV